MAAPASSFKTKTYCRGGIETLLSVSTFCSVGMPGILPAAYPELP